MSDQNQKISEFLETMDLNEPAPAEEPARQFYFNKKSKNACREAGSTAWSPADFLCHNVRLSDERTGF